MAQRKRGFDRAFWASLAVWLAALISDIVLRIKGINAPEVDGVVAALTGLLVNNLTTSRKKGDDEE